MTSEQIEASVASDPDEAGMIVDWESATPDRARRHDRH